MNTAARQAVVAEALSWLGTPYAHRQRLKGVGVDCAQLPLAVYAAAGVIGAAEVGAYASQWHLHRSEELYLRHLQALGGREIARTEAQSGDFVLWRYGRTFSHGAILTGRGGQVVHAVRGLGVVLGHFDADEDLRSRQMKLFTLSPPP
ncbi:C40 family peptidase [Caulobacter sp. S45]|uniref:C40 family peptidase n=1 Tax=Caulobacter sp. S45 TaxID=1641861 RepID=UPI001576C1A8|nr:NlpC/P60 family protein [Caulobacter sp. S45]